MSVEDEKLFNSYTFIIESFFKNLENKYKREVDQKIGNKKVIFWGYAPYFKLINGILKEV